MSHFPSVVAPLGAGPVEARAARPDGVRNCPARRLPHRALVVASPQLRRSRLPRRGKAGCRESARDAWREVGASGRRAVPHHSAQAVMARSIKDMSATQEIVDSIDTRLRQLSEEIRTLVAARSALDGRAGASFRPAASKETARQGSASIGRNDSRASVKRGRGATAAVARESARRARRAGRKPSRRSAGRNLKAVHASQLESLLSENGALSTTALAERSSGDHDRVLNLLRELEAAGRIRRSGQRRGTRWHLVTDEDRIRERAAELEATRKRPA
jgi:hypothetical protein